MMMQLPPTASAERDINSGPLRQAGLKTGLEDDSFFDRFKFHLDVRERVWVGVGGGAGGVRISPCESGGTGRGRRHL